METSTAATVQDMIATGRIVEAKTLLNLEATSLNAEELHACTLAIEQRQMQAEALIDRAEAMEREGMVEDAKVLYESVLEVAVDFPGIREHLKRMDEALALTRAMQRRSRRSKQSLPPKKGQRPKRALLSLGLGLAAALVATALFLGLAPPKSPPVTLKKPVPDPVPQAAGLPIPPPSAAPETVSEGKTMPPEPTASPQPVVIADASESAQPAPAAPPLTEPPPSPTQPWSPPKNPVFPPTPQPSAEPVQPQADIYTVQPGDSLSLIAERQFCDKALWPKIHQRNRDRIVDPQKLQPGMTLNLGGLESRCPPRP